MLYTIIAWVFVISLLIGWIHRAWTGKVRRSRIDVVVHERKDRE